MTRSNDISAELARNRANTRKAIHARRLAKLLPLIAKRHGISLVKLEALAIRAHLLCALCCGPMPTPTLYHVEQYPIALLCGRCFAAVEKTGGMLHKLRKHRRFNTDYVANRGRLSRFIALHSDLPNEIRFDLIEERLRIELLEEDQPLMVDPLVIEDNEGR